MTNIQDKIEKLLTRTVENGATESEAQSALLLARKLMLKYKIDKINTHQKLDDDIYQIELDLNFTKENVWPRQLLSIFIKNCGIFNYVKTYSNYMHYVLFGLKTDVDCVKVLFKCAHDLIINNANNNYNEYVELFGKESSDGIKEAYIQGFLAGLEYKYNEQNNSNKNFELLVIPDKKVEDAFNKFTNNFTKANIVNDIKINHDTDIINKGFRDGKSFGTTPLNNSCLQLNK